MSYVLVVAGIGAAVSVGVYAYEEYQADEAAKNRPVYQIPEEIKQNLTQAQQQALHGLPEEQKRQYIENVQRGSAQSLASSQSRKGGLTGITAINQQQGQAYNQMLSADAQARAQNQRQLMGARGDMADYKDQAFQFNVVDPYYEKIAGDKQRSEDLAQNLTSSAGMATKAAGSGTKTQKTPTQDETLGSYANTPQIGGYENSQYDYMNQQNRNNQDINYNRVITS